MLTQFYPAQSHKTLYLIVENAFTEYNVDYNEKTFFIKKTKMTPRELRLDGAKPVFEKIDRDDLIGRRLLDLKQIINGWNATLNYEEIPLKLKLETYNNEIDFEHLTEKDLDRIKNAPSRLNKVTEEWYSILNY